MTGRRAFIRRMAMAVVAHGLLSWELGKGDGTRMVPAREWGKMYPTPYRVERIEITSHDDGNMRRFIKLGAVK